MKNVTLIAPPAAGKGVLSKELEEAYGYTIISISSLLKERSLIDQSLLETMQSGKLIEDSVVLDVLKAKLNKLGDTPYVMDGFPRTIFQAEEYEKLLNELGIDLGIVIYLDVDEDELKNRVVTRIVCPNCKSSYSTRNEMHFPKIDGICDRCSSKLIQRDDDKEEVFLNRYHEYLEKTSPLIKYYEDLNLLERIKETNSDKIFTLVSDLIK